jgi:hypothetical protein
VTDRSGMTKPGGAGGGALSGPTPDAMGKAGSNTAYNDSMRTIKSDYKAASAKCSQMASAERRSCVKDAKAVRSADTKRAKEMRVSAMGPR